MRRYAYVGGLTALAPTFLSLAAADPSVPVAYCATINTASTDANYSIYQSQGLCYSFCNDDGYALGIVQANDCWCSDYVPGDTVSTSECESGCPGYPDDYCGGDDTYGYMKLSAAVSGTQGATSSTTSSSTSTSSSSSSSTTSTSTSDDSLNDFGVQTIVTTTQSLPPKTVTVTETSPQISVSTPSTSSTASSSSSSSDHTTTTSLTSEKSSSESVEQTSTPDKDPTTPTPETTTSSSSTRSVFTSVKTVTSNGQVVYQTVTTTASASPDGGGGLSGGAIAGIVIGILLILALFIAGALLFRRHRRNREGSEGTPLATGMAHRRGSSAGIMSKTGTISSSGFGMAMEEDGYGAHRMSMKPMDPRLDPKQTFGLYRAASHDSINTLRDDHDYSRRVHEPGRVLRVTNMDPTDDHN